MSKLTTIVCDGCGKIMWQEKKDKWSGYRSGTQYRLGKLVWYNKDIYPNREPRVDNSDECQSKGFEAWLEDEGGSFNGCDRDYSTFSIVLCEKCGCDLMKTMHRIDKRLKAGAKLHPEPKKEKD